MTVTVSVHDRGATHEYHYPEPARCLVGRGEDCDIRVPHRRVSRRHCLLETDPPMVWVRDLGSRNGTFVGGRRVDPLADRLLGDGDELSLGGVRDLVLRLTVPGPFRAPLPETFAGYDLVREIGRGAQGIVHLARHRGTGEYVAVKRMPTHPAADDSARFAFLREYETLRALRHPHVVAFHSGVLTDDEFCFACEYCRGGGLDRLVVRRGGRLPVGDALPITLQVLDALAYAHDAPVPALGERGVSSARGLVHRDVKPHNILLSDQDGGVVKLGDFGLAKSFEYAGLSGHTRTGAFGGSVPFTPRTQLLGYRDAGPEVDVWAAAACLYWMLTGATPRDFPAGSDPVAVGLREPVVPVRRRLPSLGTRLADVLDEALVDRPAHRITRAEEFASALRAV
ncbi:protein kinase domain-containing protein [Saccharomonospora cyanea]|uniref:non-specific serine/threonine protein kinase n=1 Tax=Saccharomonospora cyanea NA-134 TaxID=882082 RepID=H5XCS5_9PSEU|nr:FHA domain-containing serine/threonine-protein kinase [Saccharomonospora cyanea]EHR62319.1 serine/threonine protein kinase [Saccharomonospora cyanea NA-134]